MFTYKPYHHFWRKFKASGKTSVLEHRSTFIGDFRNAKPEDYADMPEIVKAFCDREIEENKLSCSLAEREIICLYAKQHPNVKNHKKKYSTNIDNMIKKYNRLVNTVQEYNDKLEALGMGRPYTLGDHDAGYAQMRLNIDTLDNEAGFARDWSAVV